MEMSWLIMFSIISSLSISRSEQQHKNVDSLQDHSNGSPMFLFIIIWTAGYRDHKYCSWLFSKASINNCCVCVVFSLLSKQFVSGKAINQLELIETEIKWSAFFVLRVWKRLNNQKCLMSPRSTVNVGSANDDEIGKISVI